MNFQSNKLRDAVVVALIAGAATSVTAQAQEATNLDRISVTGSRIKSTDIETSQPVLSLTRADIEKQGVTSVADILQRVAANGAALNRTFNNGGDGSAGVSLRNLGEGRTARQYAPLIEHLNTQLQHERLELKVLSQQDLAEMQLRQLQHEHQSVLQQGVSLKLQNNRLAERAQQYSAQYQRLQDRRIQRLNLATVI